MEMKFQKRKGNFLVGVVAFVTALGLHSCLSPVTANKEVSALPMGKSIVRAMNPVCPEGVYIADPEVRQMPDGKVYLYGSRDEQVTGWCSHSYNVLSTSDMVNWHMEQTSFATQGVGKQVDYTENILYAPDCIYNPKDGKYYLYYCLRGGGENEGVAVSDSPYGPFRDGKKIGGITGIDPSVFIDDDGQAYLFWGQWSGKGARLSKDMRSIEGEVTDSLVTYKRDFFNEGSSIRKQNGIYYYVYGGHSRHGRSNCATLNYATSTSPLGPYTYRGVIIDNFDSGRNLENNHGCIFKVNGNWYVAYHRPTHASSTVRKACIEPITFNEDGTINEVEMTTQGVGGPISPLTRMEAYRACKLSGNLMPVVRRPAYDVPVEYLSAIRHGDAAWWKYYDFDAARVNRFVCKTWDKNAKADIEIRLDGPEGKLIGVCHLEPMQGETAYAMHSAQVKPVEGRHAVVLVFKSPEGNAETDLLNLEWFAFDSFDEGALTVL